MKSNIVTDNSMASPLLEQDKQSRLKALIAKGKDQGYLTYAEVNEATMRIYTKILENRQSSH